jgi:hypothetical protein
MRWKKVKKKCKKDKNKDSQQKDPYDRVLWRPTNPWPLP